MQKELARLKEEEPDLNEQQMASKAAARISAKGYTTFQTHDSSNAYARFDRSNAKMLSAETATLRSMKKRMQVHEAPADWDRGLEHQAIRSMKMDFSAAQCSRMMKKKKRSKGWGF